MSGEGERCRLVRVAFLTAARARDEATRAHLYDVAVSAPADVRAESQRVAREADRAYRQTESALLALAAEYAERLDTAPPGLV